MKDENPFNVDALLAEIVALKQVNAMLRRACKEYEIPLPEGVPQHISRIEARNPNTNQTEWLDFDTDTYEIVGKGVK